MTIEKTPFELFRENPIARWTVGDREVVVDMSGLKPFTLGQKKRLEAEMKVRFTVGSLSAEDESKLLFFIMRDFNKDITQEDVDEMPVILAQRVSLFSGERAMDIDRPFSTRLTSSPAATAGEATSLAAGVPQS